MKNSRLPSTSNKKQVLFMSGGKGSTKGCDINQIVATQNQNRTNRGFQDKMKKFHKGVYLTGPIRHLKVEPHYREPTSRLWLSPQTYRKTSKIRLTGNWIEKAGFICHERIRVIPMHRMLIIVPETGCTNEHELKTNEHE
jgi:hypothetical protein